MAECHAVIGDIQSPYHSRKALDVACQILEAVRPTSLTLNGDTIDCRKLALRYPADDGARDGLISELKEELERSGSVVRQLVKAAKCKTRHWVDGNHEYRIWRAMAMAPQTMQLMGIQSVRHALCALSLLGIDDLKFEYHGAYPNGFWLRGDAPVEQNFWVEHGYLCRKKTGYTANALLDARKCNVICGHVERLVAIPHQVVGTKGKRIFFACEGGNLSGIGESGVGNGVYTGIPHSVPEYMDHQSGFFLLHFDGEYWTPEPVYINDGRAMFRGKVYKA